MEDKKDPKDVPLPHYNYHRLNTESNPENQYADFQHGVPSEVAMSRHLQPPPKDYLVMAILVTIFCCLPFGIVGIVKSSSARTMYATGNHEEAKRSSVSASTWVAAGFVCGLIFWVVEIVYIVYKIKHADPQQYYGYY